MIQRLRAMPGPESNTVSAHCEFSLQLCRHDNPGSISLCVLAVFLVPAELSGHHWATAELSGQH